jgi:hypothetical protein
VNPGVVEFGLSEGDGQFALFNEDCGDSVLDRPIASIYEGTGGPSGGAGDAREGRLFGLGDLD